MTSPQGTTPTPADLTDSEVGGSTPPAPSPSKLSQAWSSWPGRLVRFGFALLPLYWLTRKVDWRDVWHRALDVGLWGLAGGFSALFLSQLVGVLRWRIMLRAYGATNLPSYPTMLRHSLVGLYFNILPSGLAGDAVRGHRLRHAAGSATASYTAIFVERLAGLMGLLFIAGGAMLSDSSLRGGAATWAMDMGLVGGLGLAMVAFVLPYFLKDRPAWREKVSALPVAGPILVRIPPARSLWGPLVSLPLSVITQGSVVLCVAAIIGPLSHHASLAVCARVVPAIILFTYIPLTPGGMGQREYAFVSLFGLAHVEPATSVATSLLFFATLLALSALGGLCLLAERVMDLDS